VVNRIGKNGVAVAFETLRLRVSQIRQVRSKSVKVVSRWSNLTKCDVFAQWCKKTRVHMQTKFISIKVVARWKHQTAMHFLDAWQVLASEKAKKSWVLRRVLFRMQHHAVSLIFETWAHMPQFCGRHGATSSRQNDIVTASVL